MITTNIAKAKVIAHSMRRAIRAEAFKPLDIEATIPALATAAEAQRQVIRNADAVTQTKIDSSTTEAELKQLVS